jgi:hypothetical protein
MRGTTSDTSGGKKRAHLTMSVPATSKRLRSTTNPAAPKSVDQELGEGGSEEEADDSGRSSVFSLLV